MSIKESALSAITAITNSDFIRVVTSSGASRKISLANFFNKTIYTGENGMQISKVGKLASIDIMPLVTTTSSSPVVETISNAAYRPVADIDIATQVYNGSSYVDCWFQITTAGAVSIKSASGGTIAGYQSRYCKLKGLTYMCQG